MRKWFSRPAVRHLSSVLVSVLLSTALVPYLGEPAAKAVGQAAGAVVGGGT